MAKIISSKKREKQRQDKKNCATIKFETTHKKQSYVSQPIMSNHVYVCECVKMCQLTSDGRHLAGLGHHRVARGKCRRDLQQEEKIYSV